ncbi:hypothetical protein J7D54_00885 [Tessaracoccus sp. MC1865]|uniref:hypothetical protein n=1 Tax=Tessaracoccus sp. MC1865 TaxID=2760310 RepID=UPI001AE8B6CC|nr:hypothetical protein [Tessaracoccus sp. MC1865]QTO37695.1 hypothetical protein J7D54_00885 [Tessaracoccus sp. MC1865]
MVLATDIIPVSPRVFMYALGLVDILAGVLVALRPKIGSLVVAAWLLGIIVNLLILGGFYDVALRDQPPRRRLGAQPPGLAR